MNIAGLIRRLYAESPDKTWPTLRPGEYLDRRQYVSASEVGSCLRKLAYDKMFGVNAEKTLITSGFAERGNAVEAWFNALFNSKGGHEYDGERFTFILVGENQRTMANGYQSGTPDGIIVFDTGTALVLDIKSIDPRLARKALPKIKHVMQVQQNIALARKELKLNVTGAVILYVNCSDFNDMLPIEVEADEKLISRLEDRARRVMCAAKPEDLPAEGMLTNDCKYCAHTAACSAAEYNTSDIDLEGMNDVFRE